MANAATNINELTISDERCDAALTTRGGEGVSGSVTQILLSPATAQTNGGKQRLSGAHLHPALY